jgi:hypothetical protein
LIFRIHLFDHILVHVNFDWYCLVNIIWLPSCMISFIPQNKIQIWLCLSIVYFILCFHGYCQISFERNNYLEYYTFPWVCDGSVFNFGLYDMCVKLIYVYLLWHVFLVNRYKSNLFLLVSILKQILIFDLFPNMAIDKF